MQQIGHAHGLIVVGVGYLALNAPDNTEIVLFYLVHVPGDRQGKLTQRLRIVLRSQLLVELIGPGHDPFNVFCVFF